MSTKKMCAFRLDKETRDALEELSEALGTTKTAVLEALVDENQYHYLVHHTDLGQLPSEARE